MSEVTWSASTVLTSLWEWFCKLSLEERMQALAIDDQYWIRLYLKLFRYESKARNRDCGLAYAVKRDRVNWLYGRCLKHAARQTQNTLGPVLNDGSAAGQDDGDSDSPEVTERACKSLETAGMLPSRGSEGVRDGEDEDECEALLEEDSEIVGALKLATSADEDPSAVLNSNQSGVRAGQLIQRSLRLCSLKRPFDTLTLSQASVEDPQALQRILKLASKEGFLSRPMSPQTVKQLNLPPSATASTLQTTPVSSDIQVSLPESPWLQDKDADELISLQELLVNRLELSLWISYWKRAHKVPTAPKLGTLRAVVENSRRLLAFSEKLDRNGQSALFDGLRPAQRFLKPSKSLENNERGLLTQLMERLLFIPVHWVYKDNGQAVTKVLDRVQTACADSVASELLASEGGPPGGEKAHATGTRGRGKKKKGRRKGKKEKQEEQDWKVAEREDETQSSDEEREGWTMDSQGRRVRVETEPESLLVSSEYGKAVVGAMSGRLSKLDCEAEDEAEWEQVGKKGKGRKVPTAHSLASSPASSSAAMTLVTSPKHSAASEPVMPTTLAATPPLAQKKPNPEVTFSYQSMREADKMCQVPSPGPQKLHKQTQVFTSPHSGLGEGQDEQGTEHSQSGGAEAKKPPPNYREQLPGISNAHGYGQEPLEGSGDTTNSMSLEARDRVDERSAAPGGISEMSPGLGCSFRNSAAQVAGERLARFDELEENGMQGNHKRAYVAEPDIREQHRIPNGVASLPFPPRMHEPCTLVHDGASVQPASEDQQPSPTSLSVPIPTCRPSLPSNGNTDPDLPASSLPISKSAAKKRKNKRRLERQQEVKQCLRQLMADVECRALQQTIPPQQLPHTSVRSRLTVEISDKPDSPGYSVTATATATSYSSSSSALLQPEQRPNHQPAHCSPAAATVLTASTSYEAVSTPQVSEATTSVAISPIMPLPNSGPPSFRISPQHTCIRQSEPGINTRKGNDHGEVARQQRFPQQPQQAPSSSSDSPNSYDRNVRGHAIRQQPPPYRQQPAESCYYSRPRSRGDFSSTGTGYHHASMNMKRSMPIYSQQSHTPPGPYRDYMPQYPQQRQMQQQHAHYYSRMQPYSTPPATPTEEETAALKEQKQAERYTRDMHWVRHSLAVNIDSFMLKREAEMRVHRAQRQLVVDEITRIVHGLWTRARVELYGSCFTGLDLVSSDVDIVVCGLPSAYSSPESSNCSPHSASNGQAPAFDLQTPYSGPNTEVWKSSVSTCSSVVSSQTNSPRVPPSPLVNSPSTSPCLNYTAPSMSPPSTRISPKLSPCQSTLPRGHGDLVKFLHDLANALEGKPWIRSMKTIDTAFVPVIKLVADPCTLGGGPAAVIPIDLSLEGPQHGGIASSLLIQDVIKPGGPYSHAVPLTLVLKTLLNQRGLNQPWCGGLSSYALMLMVIALLQQFETPEVAAANVIAIAQSVNSIKRRMSTVAGVERSQVCRAGNSNATGPLPLQYTMYSSPSSGDGNLGDLSYRSWAQSMVNTSGALSVSQASLRRGGSDPGARTYPMVSLTPRIQEGRLSQGFLLTYFLEFYGRIFNPKVEGIAIDQGYGLTFALADYLLKAGIPACDPITILDPLDYAVNASRSCFRIGELQWIFAQCLQQFEMQGVDKLQRMGGGMCQAGLSTWQQAEELLSKEAVGGDEKGPVDTLGLILSY